MNAAGFQSTIGKPVTVQGIGLHTGNPCTLTVKPAPPDSGICFVRSDLDGCPVIPARHDLVSATPVRGTAIGLPPACVYTVEHLLAACSALGLDNLEITMDNSEPPILDGSALPFLTALSTGGRSVSSVARQIAVLSEPVVYESGATRLTAFPADSFSLDCVVDYDHPFLGRQHIALALTPESFERELAPARTFCFDYEIEALKARGLARGGDFSNAVVVGISGIRNPDPLRFPDEFVRHKALDIIGDLSLLGMPLRARVEAVRSGHSHNIAFVNQLARRVSAEPARAHS